MFKLAFLVGAGAYEVEWAEFQARQGSERQDRVPTEAFKATVDFVKKFNAETESITLSYTGPLADMSFSDYEEMLAVNSPGSMSVAMRQMGLRYAGVHKPEKRRLRAETSIDWVAKGAVTPVKNQGTCGSCWSFSTTGALEGAYQIKSGKLESLSEQQFIDCSHLDKGCQGGDMDNGFKFAESHDICKEDSYSYTGKNLGSCEAQGCKVAIPAHSVTGYKIVKEDDEQGLLSAVQKSPVSIAVEADQMTFQLYHGGVLTSQCGNKLDHGVLLVGFGEDKGAQYWKVKNSWGATWGEQGYIRLERGGGQRTVGQCGIKGEGSYPVLSA